MDDLALVEEELAVAVSSGTVTERAARAAALVRARMDVRWVGIYTVANGEVRNVAWNGPGPPAHPVFPIDRGLTSHACRSREVVVSNDTANDPRYLTNQEDSGSELIAPVVVDDKVVGTLDVESDSTDAFDDADIAGFSRLARVLALLWTQPLQ